MAKTTMADVAARAGVTVATVSRALNPATSHELRTETIERIRQAARSLGYRPNELARGVRTRRSRAVGMSVPDIANPFMPPIVRAVEEVLAAAGYTLMVVNTDNNPWRARRGLETLVAHQVEGLLIASALYETDLLDDPTIGSIPVVLVNRRTKDLLPMVVPDERQGVGLVVDHLVELGHRHIAHIAGPSTTSTGRGRAAGFVAAASAAGVHEPDLFETTTRLTVEEGERACAALLARHPEVTAIFAAGDLLAVGCLRMLRQQGRRVPEEVSLVGYNDLSLVDLLEPPLTTVRNPTAEMGRLAGEMMLSLLADDELTADEMVIELEGELVVRGTTARCAEPAVGSAR